MKPGMASTVAGGIPTTDALCDGWLSGREATGYRLDWGDCWRLECLSDGRDQVFPKLRESRLALTHTLPRPIILIGEEAAGESSLIFWLKAREAARAASADDRPANAESPWSSVEEVDLAQFPGGRLEDLIAFLTRGSGNDLGKFLSKHRNKTLVVYMRLDHLDPAMGSELLGSLRRAFESASGDASLRGLALVLMGRDERAFDTEPYSAIADVAELCRLPRFSRDEVSRLLGHHWRDAGPGRFDAQALEAQRITGGQPLLTQMLIKQLDRDRPDGFDANRIYRQLRDNPPAALVAWRTRLARMILRDEPIRASVRDLLGGREYPIDADEPQRQAPYYLRSLSLSGWLSPSLDADGNARVWRLSDLHRFWAGAVLREPAAFVNGGRATGNVGEGGR